MHTDNATLSCLIVDDEPLAQEVLQTHVAKIPSLRVVQVCNNAMEAFEALHKHQIDLVFLDINMPVISGLNFLSSLKEPPAVIFTTAYPEYAVDGFELDAVDYLLKPISFQRFSKAIDKVFARVKQLPGVLPEVKAVAISEPASNLKIVQPEKDYFFVKADNKLVKVSFADILFIEGMKDYLKMQLKTGTPIVIHQTMKGMEDQLPSNRFMRIHKSYIVSLEAIQAIEGAIVHLGKNQIPVSNTYREMLLAAVASGK
ncbi:LytR/AlgR family response regulator transcription factor [Taibaiella soli]|uniref:DNA-binding response regulator n=1 Tax=Taibaiella soli TaxID=1649169 RepID=A0A2W2B1E2_9BACT|nr:response regulator transcription factor [Taibaiella soli]PZF74064.1 DNA-binding response regulator [Taibaiella soli]